MVSEILNELKYNSVVSLIYTLKPTEQSQEYKLYGASESLSSQDSGSSLYAIMVFNHVKTRIKYTVYHLTGTELKELYNKLPQLLQVTTNFHISDNTIIYESSTNFIKMDPTNIKDLVGYTKELVDRPNTVWNFLTFCKENKVKCTTEDGSQFYAESMRFSDSSPNIVVPIQDSEGKFHTKIVYSLDDSVPVEQIFIYPESVPAEFMRLVTQCSPGIYKVNMQYMPQNTLDLQEFYQNFTIQMLISLLNTREYYKVFMDAISIIRFWEKLVGRSEAEEIPTKSYPPQKYSRNYYIRYTVSKPKVSDFKKPAFNESEDEYLSQVQYMLGEQVSIKDVQQFVNRRCSDSFFTPILAELIFSLLKLRATDKDLEGITKLVKSELFTLSLEVFKWKSMMLNYGFRNPMLTNKCITQMGTIELREE